MLRFMPWVWESHINDLSPGCIPSGTAPLSPTLPFPTSSRPITMGDVAGRSRRICPPIPPPLAPLLFYPLSNILQAVPGSRLGLSHHNLQSLGALFERYSDTFYHRGVVRGEVTSDDVPLLIPRRQLEANDVWFELMNGLHCIPR